MSDLGGILLGIKKLSEFAVIMEESGISIFAVSAYNTDYILIKENIEIGNSACFGI